LRMAAAVRACHGLSVSTSMDVGPGLRAGTGLSGKDLNPGDGPVRCSGDGRFRTRPAGAHRLCRTVSRPPPRVAAIAQLGKPVAHLEHAGVFWPNVGLHLSPFLGQESAPASPFDLSVLQRAGHEDAPAVAVLSACRARVPVAAGFNRARQLSRRPGTLPAVSWHAADLVPVLAATHTLPRSGRLPFPESPNIYGPEPT
jgi:hypothetical protein